MICLLVGDKDYFTLLYFSVKSCTVRLKTVKSCTVRLKTVGKISYCKAKNCGKKLSLAVQVFFQQFLALQYEIFSTVFSLSHRENPGSLPSSF